MLKLYLGDNCIQNFHLGRYIVGYTVGNLVLRRRVSGAVKRDFRTYMFLFCLVFTMFCARLFICASWSPAGKGLTSWLLFVVSSVSLSLSHWYPGSGVVLDCIDS